MRSLRSLSFKPLAVHNPVNLTRRFRVHAAQGSAGRRCQEETPGRAMPAPNTTPPGRTPDSTALTPTSKGSARPNKGARMPIDACGAAGASPSGHIAVAARASHAAT